MTSTDKQVLYIFVATVVVRVVFHLLTNFTYDDAYITFRYVDNIVTGKGFVYNEGAHVLGTTTPLFTLLLSFFRVFGLPLGRISFFVSIICAGGTAVLIYRLAQKLRLTHFAVIPSVIFILFPRLLATDTGGMETAFFTFLLMGGFYAYWKRLPYYAIGAATLAAVTRPEGFLLLVLLLVVYIFQDKRDWWRYLFLPALIIIPWFVFSYFYFGSIVPNSITAKLALYSRFGTRPVLDNIIFLMGFNNPLGIGLFVLACLGGYWLWVKQRFGIFPLIWLIGMIIPLALSKTHLFLWYVSPIYPVYLLFAGGAFPLLAERCNITAAKVPLIGNLTVILLVAVMVVGNVKNVRYFSAYQNTLETVHKNIGMYLRAESHASDIVAAEDIGYMGYFSQRYIIDRDGLVSPEAVPYNRDGNYFQLITDFKPHWVVASPEGAHSQFIYLPEFLASYELEQAYKADFGSEYHIYKRIVH